MTTTTGSEPPVSRGNASATELPTIVVGHGPRTDLLVVATVYPAVVAVLLALGAIFLPKFGPTLGFGGGIIVVLACALLFTWGWAGHGPEQVVLCPEGILTRHRFLATPMLVDGGAFVRWEWLDPEVRGRVRLGFAYFRWHQPGGFLTWFRLPATPTQAAAIRAYPACPKAYRDPDRPLR